MGTSLEALVRIDTPKERDYFDVRGSEEVLQRLKPLYALLSAEENIDLSAGPTTHGYSRENRESMYRWFNQVTGISDAVAETIVDLGIDWSGVETLSDLQTGLRKALKWIKKQHT